MLSYYWKRQLGTVILPSFFVAALFIAAIFQIILPAFERSLMESKKEMLKELTHVALNILIFIEKQEGSGQLTREQAQTLALESIKSVHYGEDDKDYFWINDMHPTMVMHPYRPDLTGQDLSDFTDHNGKRLFVSFVETVKKEGAGYVDYMWQWKDNPARIVPKLSYVEEFKPWGWIIGTGVYIEDARLEFAKITRNVAYMSGAILCGLALFGFYIIVHALRTARAQHKAEEEVKRYRNNLEKLVDTRTGELTTTNKLLHQEITDRKQTELKLRESESRYRSIFELANDAIFILNGRLCVNCNHRTLEMFGCKKIEQFIGRSPCYFSPEQQPDGRDSREKGREKWDRAIQGKPQFFEWRHTRLDGTVFDAEVSLNMIEDSGRKSVQAIVRDVTGRKVRERELLKNQNLESLGVLAGGIAHDFNNLLTVIIGNLSLAKLLAGNKDKILEKLNQSEKASWQAKELTMQLLTFSKGGAPIKKLTSIKELIQDSTSFSLRGSNIRFEYEFDENLWPVEVDDGQLSQVIQNLVINAHQAMASGGTVKIKAINVLVTDQDDLPLNQGKYIQISVEDQGNGIPAEYLEKIFDPYFSTKKQGSGLGLAVAYSVIKKHDGCIKVDSAPGQGSTFRIYLPAIRTGGEASSKETFATVIPGKGRILVMDDEDFIRDFMSSALCTMGYEAVMASNGQEAIALYAQAMEANSPFAAVIMDLTIPGGMGGKEAIHKLLELDPKVKAIVASGYANDPIMSDCTSFGFQGVVAKPFDIYELSRVLHELLQAEEPALPGRRYYS